MQVTKNEISKVTPKNDRASVQFKETAGDEINSVTKDCGAVVHKDLVAAMNRMKIHLVVLTEQPEASKVTLSTINDFDISLLDNYTITGYGLLVRIHDRHHYAFRIVCRKPHIVEIYGYCRFAFVSFRHR